LLATRKNEPARENRCRGRYLRFGALLLIVAVVVFAPHIADRALVKERLITTLKRSTGADIDYKHLRLDLLPHPHVTLEQVEISIPPGVEATALSLTIRPAMLPLLRGTLQLAAVRLESSELQWRLPKTVATDTPLDSSFQSTTWAKEWPLFSPLFPNSPYRIWTFGSSTAG
jgi:hypothetical protein